MPNSCLITAYHSGLCPAYVMPDYFVQADTLSERSNERFETFGLTDSTKGRLTNRFFSRKRPLDVSLRPSPCRETSIPENP